MGLEQHPQRALTLVERGQARRRSCRGLCAKSSTTVTPAGRAHRFQPPARCRGSRTERARRQPQPGAQRHGRAASAASAFDRVVPAGRTASATGTRSSVCRSTAMKRKAQRGAADRLRRDPRVVRQNRTGTTSAGASARASFRVVGVDDRGGRPPSGSRRTSPRSSSSGLWSALTLVSTATVGRNSATDPSLSSHLADPKVRVAGQRGRVRVLVVGEVDHGRTVQHGGLARHPVQDQRDHGGHRRTCRWCRPTATDWSAAFEQLGEHLRAAQPLDPPPHARRPMSGTSSSTAAEAITRPTGATQHAAAVPAGWSVIPPPAQPVELGQRLAGVQRPVGAADGRCRAGAISTASGASCRTRRCRRRRWGVSKSVSVVMPPGYDRARVRPATRPPPPRPSRPWWRSWRRPAPSTAIWRSG